MGQRAKADTKNQGGKNNATRMSTLGRILMEIGMEIPPKIRTLPWKVSERSSWFQLIPADSSWFQLIPVDSSWFQLPFRKSTSFRTFQPGRWYLRPWLWLPRCALGAVGGPPRPRQRPESWRNTWRQELVLDIYSNCRNDLPHTSIHIQF